MGAFYGITQGTLAAKSNYTLIFTGADLTVTSARSGSRPTPRRVYGDADPALTYQVGGSGLGNGDSLSGGLARSAATASNGGAYGITQGTLAANSNYTMNHASADLTVTQRAITVTADGKTRLRRRRPGADLSGRRPGPREWRHAVWRFGEVGGDSQQCRLYAITQGTLAANSNYMISGSPAPTSDQARSISVAADAKTRSTATRIRR